MRDRVFRILILWILQYRLHNFARLQQCYETLRYSIVLYNMNIDISIIFHLIYGIQHLHFIKGFIYYSPHHKKRLQAWLLTASLTRRHSHWSNIVLGGNNIGCDYIGCTCGK
jgi:hypothetical protein